jgi:hypothetical protein
MIKATYGVGSFKYDIALKILTENITPSAKIVVGKVGAGRRESQRFDRYGKN